MRGKKNMHREIQIKQFPIVTTHWWPKTRNERFVWENEQYLYRFLPLVHNHVQVIWVRTRIRCVTCVCARSGSSASTLDGGRVWSVVLTRRHSYNNQSHTSLVLHERDWVFAWGDLIGWRLRWCLKSCISTTLQTRPPSSVDADAPCECSVSQSARTHTHTHTSHTGCVRTQITWIWLCTRGKKQYKYCSFSHTNRSFRVLGHQCVVTMGNCLIWISLCMFFFPLIETVTYTCHYDWQTRTVWTSNILKTSKLDLMKKKRHLHLGCPWGKLIDTKF